MTHLSSSALNSPIFGSAPHRLVGRLVVVVPLLAIVLATHAAAEEIQFVETFALAEDREEALKQLIPGTEDYYYYHCLHYLNTERYDEVEKLLKTWIDRYRVTDRVREIQHRLHLQTYATQPERALTYLRNVLNLRFDHQREQLEGDRNLPSVLDPKVISRETLTQRALARQPNLQGFELSAFRWLLDRELTADQRRELLGRLERPDYPNLAKLVVADLRHQYSRGFGSLNIHSNLLKSQLDACLELMPELRNQNNFIQVYLVRLQPNADVDLSQNDAAMLEYLERLWEFVSTLSPAHNSLKAHVLYQRLQFDREHGVYNRERFLDYIQLPRNMAYVARPYLQQEKNRGFLVDLNAGYDQITRFGPIGNDQELIESYLQHFFLEDATFEDFRLFLDDEFLKRIFAETKLVHGLGDPERWFSMLSPAALQALRERVDLDFAYDNAEYFEVDEPVSVDLYVKNVETLIIKVYRINTLSYYLSQMDLVTTDVQLDGLVANDERTVEYDVPPLRRVERHFEFPQLSQRGVYVVDFIGSGKSSRALIRKGRLHHLVRTTTAGQVFTILNEQNEVVPNAAVHLGGKRYEGDEEGEVLVPFSSQPGMTPIVLSHDGFASLAQFYHEGEAYELRAGIYVDRESLLQHRRAKAVIRPGLYLNGVPVSLEVLEDVTLSVTSTNHDGIPSTRVISDFTIEEGTDSVFEFQVPPRLSSLVFTLEGKVAPVSRTTSEKVSLSASDQFTLNQIAQSDKIEDLHLLQASEQYTLLLLGKTGESRENRPMKLTLKHKDFVEPVVTTLRTDEQGRIALGPLTDIAFFTAESPTGVQQQFPLRTDRHNYPAAVSGRATSVVEVPFMGDAAEVSADEISLLSYRAERYYADHLDSVELKNGLLRLKELAPGDYELYLKQLGQTIRVRITEGVEKVGYAIGESRALEVREASPLQVSEIDTDDDQVSIQVQNANEFTRVHVFASRYVPDYDLFKAMIAVRDAEPYVARLDRPSSLYVAGRNIGDEYRYIIDRKYARHFPGNMLERPELLLNPWAIRSTETDVKLAAKGDEFQRLAEEMADSEQRNAYGGNAAEKFESFSTLDFLSENAVVLMNLRPDEAGRISIPRKDLGTHLHLHVVAIDPLNTVFRNHSLSYRDMDFIDLRLEETLELDTHFTQQKQVSVVNAEQKFTIGDVTASRFETYDSLQSVYALMQTLSSNETLRRFEFVTRWPTLTPDEKRSKYSEFACHELSFFLYQKDPEFFAQVIQPYLQNKKDKTFLDRWLLQMDLKEYLDPWSYSRLNTVERILLSRRLEDERAATRQYVLDQYQLLPPDRDRWTQLYNTALQASALDAERNSKLAELALLRSMTRKFERGEELTESRESLARAARPAGKPAAPATPAADPFGVAPMDAPAEMEKAKNELKKMADKDANGLMDRRAGGRYYFDNKRRDMQVEQLYQALETTKEWVENNYYQVPIEAQLAALVDVNSFWKDYVEHDPAEPFFSPFFPKATDNFTEMMFALAVLDLPWETPQHQLTFEEAQMSMVAAGPAIIFHEEIKPAEEIAEDTPILVSQNFFQRDDRYRMVENERTDKFVTEEFLVHTIYGCQIVVTNPTSSTQKLDLLVQIPEGALPVLNGQYLRSVPLRLEAFNTQTFEYYFYFPKPGEFAHYPVQISSNEELVAAADAFTFNVVRQLTKIDTESWNYVSQYGTDDDVLNYLRQKNLLNIDLSRIAFRMGNEGFFQKVTRILTERHVYDHVLWSYAVNHNDAASIRQYLQHADSFVQQCGIYLDSPLLTIEPVTRHLYQHREYHPLVNARTHVLGEEREILNNRFHEQYHQLMHLLKYRRNLSDEQHLAVTYYMLLQDRVEDALRFFGQVDRQEVATKMQYDYCAAYLNFFLEEPNRAAEIAEPYVDHPVDRWRNVFRMVTAQVAEIRGKDAELVDPFDRSQAQGDLASKAPSFDWKVEDGRIELTYQNLQSIQLNYYLMDIELLFSSNPFVQQYSSQFAFIHPNEVQTVELPEGQNRLTIDLPDSLDNKNVLVEARAGSSVKTEAYYSNSLSVQVAESYGQLRVSQVRDGQALPKAYVKVYARMQGGEVRFFKDGYTDLRGRFDYSSLSTNELDRVERFSILVMSEGFGAVIKEVAPPKR